MAADVSTGSNGRLSGEWPELEEVWLDATVLHLPGHTRGSIMLAER